MMKPFMIDISSNDIDDLKNRLSQTRWPDEPAENTRWEYGTSQGYLKQLCAYWAQPFDWKKQEAYLNSFSHYKTTIEGLSIHFLHEKGKGANSVPLLLTHGYPDSFVRFLKIIPLLNDIRKFFKEVAK